MGAPITELSDEKLTKLITTLAAAPPRAVLQVPAGELLVICRLAALGKGIDPFPDDEAG